MFSLACYRFPLDDSDEDVLCAFAAHENPMIINGRVRTLMKGMNRITYIGINDIDEMRPVDNVIYFPKNRKLVVYTDGMDSVRADISLLLATMRIANKEGLSGRILLDMFEERVIKSNKITHSDDMIVSIVERI